MSNETDTINILQKALDASWVRNDVIANNIANVDTPSYKAYRVEFEELLKKAIDSNQMPVTSTNPKHITIGSGSLNRVTPRIVRDRSTSTRLDGNNVNIDVETANLANNTIMYQALVDQLSAKLARLRTVINEGRR
jgi:flagellar basal-body rod protein FlgB